MVYCGRPSRGCYACRERKSRCDKLPDGCTQCKKAKRECPGYRQLGDVIFHDESEKVVRKAKAKEAMNKAKRDAPKASPLPVMDEVSVEGTANSPHLDENDAGDPSLHVMKDFQQLSPSDLVLLPPIEDVATGFFVSNFVSRSAKESVGPGRFDYLGEIYRNHSMDEGLLSSMRAVGFASYAHTSQSSSLLQRARNQYTQAIRHTNNSLRCADAAKKDSTLLSILVLGIFETITGCKQHSLSDWSRHINGAAAVITLRGGDQIKSVAGRRMVFQVTSNLLVICLARGKPLPEFISKITIDAVDRIKNPDPVLVVQRAMMKVTQLRADVLAGRITDPHTVMDEAVELDCVLLALVDNPPPTWRYETVYTDIKSSYVYSGKYHIYTDCWIAQLWNAIRTVRVILNELIRDVLLKGFVTKPPLFLLAIHTAQFQLSTDTLYELQSDILCSIPQHLFNMPPPVLTAHVVTQPQAGIPKSTTTCPLDLGSEYPSIKNHIELQRRPGELHSSPPCSSETSLANIESELNKHITTNLGQILALPNTCSSPSPSNNFFTEMINTQPSQANKNNSFGRTSGGNFLLWPLWHAGTMDVATDEVRAFVVQNLKDIGENLGIKQGLVMAELLENGKSGAGFMI